MTNQARSLLLSYVQNLMHKHYTYLEANIEDTLLIKNINSTRTRTIGDDRKTTALKICRLLLSLHAVHLLLLTKQLVHLPTLLYLHGALLLHTAQRCRDLSIASVHGPSFRISPCSLRLPGGTPVVCVLFLTYSERTV